METMMVAGMLVSPIGLVISILIPTMAVLFARQPQLPAVRLVAGYLGALFVLAIMTAAVTYVSPQDAASVWHVPPDRYWSSLFDLFLGTFVVVGFISIVGISFVGLPVLVGLSRSGKATAPWLILISIAISTAFAIIFYPFILSTNSTFFGFLGLLIISHAILATGFALAARLPWALRPSR